MGADILELGLEEVLPGLIVLDRDLAIDGGPTVALVGADAGRRPVLVLDGRDADSDELSIAVFDALAWARAHGDLLARHLADASLDPGAEPLVVVVGASFAPTFLRRMEPLAPSGAVLLLERRGLRSARASSSFLVPATPVARGEAPAAATPWLDRLDEAVQRRVRTLAQRLRRLDEEVSCASSRSGLRWSFRGSELCALGDDARGLVGRVAGREEPLLLAADESLEDFLDAAIVRYVALADELEELAAAGAPPPSVPPAAEAS